MSVTPASLRARFTEVANATTYPDPTLQAKIDDAALYVGVDWGKWQDLGQSYLAMHFLFVSAQTAGGLGNAAGMLVTSTQETVGAVSHTNGVLSIDPKNTDSIYMSNVYGQEYLKLRKLAFPFVALAY